MESSSKGWGGGREKGADALVEQSRDRQWELVVGWGGG